MVEIFTKQSDGSWRYLATIGLNSKVYFESVETELSLEEIYDLVEFEEIYERNERTPREKKINESAGDD